MHHPSVLAPGEVVASYLGTYSLRLRRHYSCGWHLVGLLDTGCDDGLLVAVYVCSGALDIFACVLGVDDGK